MRQHKAIEPGFHLLVLDTEENSWNLSGEVFNSAADALWFAENECGVPWTVVEIKPLAGDAAVSELPAGMLKL